MQGQAHTTKQQDARGGKDIPSSTPKGDSSRAHVNPLEKDARDFALNDRALTGASTFSMPKDQAIDHSASLSYGTGRHLSREEQTKYGAAFGYDFSDVRIYSDDTAAQAADEMGAAAFAKGNDVVFGKDEMKTSDAESDRLLAHEMVHVAQFKAGKTDGKVLRSDRDGRGLGKNPPEGKYNVTDTPGAEDNHILFDMDSTQLAGDALETLQQEAAGWPFPVEVDIYGYSSLEGSDEYNLNLSAHRAMAVKEALYGVLPLGSFVKVHAVGETDHFGDPDQNRRVGFDMRPNLLFMPPVVLPSIPSQPEFGDLLSGSFPPEAPDLLQPLFTGSLYNVPPLDYGGMAKSATSRGQTLSGSLGDDVDQSYHRMMGEMYQFLDPEMRHLLVGMTLDSSVEAHMVREHPNFMDTMAEEDKRNGTEVTGVQVNDEQIKMVYELLRDKIF